jgi:hypothetical protein
LTAADVPTFPPPASVCEPPPELLEPAPELELPLDPAPLLEPPPELLELDGPPELEPPLDEDAPGPLLEPGPPLEPAPLLEPEPLLAPEAPASGDDRLEPSPMEPQAQNIAVAAAKTTHARIEVSLLSGLTNKGDVGRFTFHLVRGAAPRQRTSRRSSGGGREDPSKKSPPFGGEPFEAPRPSVEFTGSAGT